MVEKIQPATLFPSLTTSVCKITVRKVQGIACLACQRGAKRDQETQQLKKRMVSGKIIRSKEIL